MHWHLRLANNPAPRNNSRETDAGAPLGLDGPCGSGALQAEGSHLMSIAATEASEHAPAAPPASTPFTLAVDIGGSSIKAAVLDCAGHLVAAQMRTPTPKEATPQAVLETIAGLAVQLPSIQRISVGFPGVVKGGKVLTAPNLGTQHWAGFELMGALSQRFGVPARVLNDAAVQGLGVVEGHGPRMRADAGHGGRLRALSQSPAAPATSSSASIARAGARPTISTSARRRWPRRGRSAGTGACAGRSTP